MINVTAIKKKVGGVTLIELMIVLFIATFLVAGIYSLFITQHRSYAVQDQVVGVQQDARAALDLMARDIRMAGFGAGAGSGTGFTDGTNNVVINGFNYAVNPINSTTAPDTLTVVLGAEDWGNVQSIAGGSVVTLDRNVNSNCGFVAFDLLPGRLYNVSNANDGDKTITATNVPTGSKIEGGKAYGVKAITYAVTTVDGGILRRNENTGSGAQPLAGDGINTVVEDLQFAYQVSGDASWYNAPANFPAGKTAADIRMIRINIIVMTAVADPKETGCFKPACEDNGQDNSDPGKRRRVYTTEVRVRNL